MESIEIIERIEKIKMAYRVLILVGTLLLLGGLYVWLVYFPKCDEIAKIENQNAATTRKINEAKQKTKDLAKFEEDVVQVESQYNEALTLLPKKEEIPTLLRNITELGMTSNLEFNSFSPSTGKSENMYTEIPIAIQVKGKYHDVLLFFDRVRKMKRIVNIENVSMSPSGGETTLLNVTCRAITYKFKE